MKRLGSEILSYSQSTGFQASIFLYGRSFTPTISHQLRPMRRHCTTNINRAPLISSAIQKTEQTLDQRKKPKKGIIENNGKENIQGITPRHEDYSQWYLDVIEAGELCENAPIRGCIVIRPHGYKLWEIMKEELDKRIKKKGGKNAYFPLLIPQSFLNKEAKHIQGFAKECAIVTHHRLKTYENNEILLDPDSKLEEPLIIRPTSETIIWYMFKKWIQSYRDLPLIINQWANVIRWEMRTRPFLRTTEFLWQEGHTADSSAITAKNRAKMMIDMYHDFAQELLALPTIVGLKSPCERFAGAEDTYTIEALMQNGWALQTGTSHFLGQNFAKSFDVQFKTESGEENYVWATSWGMSTRMMGALIMAHSDDTGLVLPPAVAPVQVVLVPIFSNEDQRTVVTDFATNVRKQLEAEGIRVEMDARENMRPGAKYFEWERKGVPLRLEIGPRDVAKGSVFCAKRTGGKKFAMSVDETLGTWAKKELDMIQNEMLSAARKRLESSTIQIESYQEMKERLERREFAFYEVPWRCNDENERRIKEDCKATIRCYPLGKQELVHGRKCFYSGEEADRIAIFARAY